MYIMNTWTLKSISFHFPIPYVLLNKKIFLFVFFKQRERCSYKYLVTIIDLTNSAFAVYEQIIWIWDNPAIMIKCLICSFSLLFVVFYFLFFFRGGWVVKQITFMKKITSDQWLLFSKTCLVLLRRICWFSWW